MDQVNIQPFGRVNAGVSRIELAGTLSGLLAPDAWLELSSASWDSSHTQ